MDRIKKRTGAQIAEFNKRAKAVMLEQRGAAGDDDEQDGGDDNDDETERIDKLVRRNFRNGTVK